MSIRVEARIEQRGLVELYVVDCANCGVVFAITRAYELRRREDRQGFNCPNGHGNAFGESEAERLKRELKFARERIEGEERRLEAERRSHAATKGQLTRIRNRVQNGTCPDCNRHFVNLERHMASKHAATDADRARAKRDREALS